jgi:hypothetical protein
MPIILNGANGITTSSGDITISDKIVHLDDTNTAIRFPAADTVTVETSGSERLRIDSSGNIGIGTTSPAGRLHARFDAGAGDGHTAKYIFQSLDQRLTIGTYYEAGVAQYARIQSSSASAIVTPLLLNPDGGNVGIGTSSPSSSLHIVKSLATTGTGIVSSNGIALQNTNAANNNYTTIQNLDATNNQNAQIQFINVTQPYQGAIAFTTRASVGDFTERMRIDSAGNVGIGTSSPANFVGTVKLVVGSAATTTTPGAVTVYSGTATYGGLYFADGTIGNQLYRGAVEYNHSTDALLFYSAGGERARIDSAGNLFLGTTSFSAFPTQTTGNMSIFQMALTYTRSQQNTSGRYWYYGSEGTAAATFILYNNNNTGVYLVYGGTSWTANSDERMKTPLVPFENAVDKICSLRAGTGRYLTDEEDVSRSFLIAQDVQAVLPEAVNTKDDEQGTLGLSYTDVIPLLVAAIKEQQATITSLTARIAALESQ